MHTNLAGYIVACAVCLSNELCTVHIYIQGRQKQNYSGAAINTHACIKEGVATTFAHALITMPILIFKLISQKIKRS